MGVKGFEKVFICQFGVYYLFVEQFGVYSARAVDRQSDFSLERKYV